MCESRLDVQLAALEAGLRQELVRHGIHKTVPANTPLLREGQYIQHIPLVLSGLVKVSIRHDDREMLLYYLKPLESCIMSFAGVLRGEPSRIHADAVEESELMLIPAGRTEWMLGQFPSFGRIFLDQYHRRYLDLLENLRQMVFLRLDVRLKQYLREQAALRNSDIVDLRHHQIAADLATAREVITRTLHKLEKEGDIEQIPEGIKILRVR
jgi:CRP/FNR family transcriptional regulator, anaerobic regulatory protein